MRRNPFPKFTNEYPGGRRVTVNATMRGICYEAEEIPGRRAIVITCARFDIIGKMRIEARRVKPKRSRRKQA
jgi:hypothetical protein